MPSLLSYVPTRLHPALRALLVQSLRLGPRPEHVAFIMDGNRRSARERHLPVQVGHEEGFDALKRVLSFLLKLDIPHVTVYAFSIENFNRDPSEVDALMDMARTRLVEICKHGALLHQYGVQIRVLGRRDLLPPDVQQSCLEAERMTAHNNKGILNLCCPYTSQEEIATAVKRTVDAAVDADADAFAPDRTITEATIASNLYTNASPPVDILIRTSGVSRLSDFLLWQCNEDTVLHFIEPNWPDIGVADVLPPLLSYQAEKVVATVYDWCFPPPSPSPSCAAAAAAATTRTTRTPTSLSSSSSSSEEEEKEESNSGKGFTSTATTSTTTRRNTKTVTTARRGGGRVEERGTGGTGPTSTILTGEKED